MPDSPSPAPDLPAILARADRLAAARAKAKMEPDYELLARCEHAEVELQRLTFELTPEEDVRALVAEVERLRMTNQFLRDGIVKLEERAAQDETW